MKGFFMDPEKFVITEFKNIFEARDPAGRKTFLNDRYAASFIITLKGKIAFHYGEKTVISDKDNPVFLPKGLSYENECLEDAYSLCFNFYTLETYKEPFNLHKISENFAEECYFNIEREVKGSKDTHAIFIALYSLAQKLFAKESPVKSRVGEAVRYMTENYADLSLTVKKIAASCYISEIYLRKLFEKDGMDPPFAVLTEIRMHRARELLLEKRPIKEIALLVGYSDVYQFSRAYKKHFGHSPKCESKN